MASRIRYRPDSDVSHVLVSVQGFSVVHTDNTPPSVYSVHLDTNEKTYEVVNGEDVVVHGSAKSLHGLKMAAKKELQKLGVVFNSENREGKPTSGDTLGE